MKDLITITIAGILLWWVAVYYEPAWASLVFEDNKAIVWIKIFSF
jgi:hypothetical protein